MRKSKNSLQTLEHKKFDIVQLFYYTVLIIAAIVILVPFLWMISTSFDKVDTYGLPSPPRFIPKNFSLFNYQIAVKNMPLFRYLFNTLAITTLSVIGNIILATLGGFCLSKGRFRGKSLVLIFIMSNMMIPFETKLLPTFQLIYNMGLSNTYTGVVLPSVLTSAVYIFFIKQYCDDLPNDLYEAGIIDGANKVQIYYKIYLPLMGPAIATVTILTVIACWNDLLWPMVVINEPLMKTIQIGMAQYSTEGTMHAGIATAMSVISIIPLAIIFIFLQQYIVQGISATGIKE